MSEDQLSMEQIDVLLSAAGAATFNLRCAAASLGYDSWFGLVPDPAEPELVARPRGPRTPTSPGYRPTRSTKVLGLLIDTDLREIGDWHRRTVHDTTPRRAVSTFVHTGAEEF